MTPEQAHFLLTSVYLPQVHNEHKTTRRVLEAVPGDKCGYKPDPHSKTALELAAHIATSECFFMNGVAKGKFEFAGPPALETPAAVLAWYDDNFPKASAAFATTSADDLVKTIDFRGVFNFPAIVYAGLMLNHSIHHRGQLSAYLRAMGSKVPKIYGGSYDEPIQPPAQASA